MKIIVLGAYGFTGRLICSEISKRKLKFSTAGRDLNKLEEIKKKSSFLETIHILSSEEQSAIDSTIEPYDLIINCIGPYMVKSFGIVQSCMRQNKIYIDITGELNFVLKSYEYYQRLNLQHKGCIVHSCSFESLISELGMSILSRNYSNPAETNTYYLFNHTRPSPGTRRTMKLRAYYEDMLLKNGEIRAAKSEDLFNNMSFVNHSESIGYLSPYPEIFWAHLNHKSINSASYLLINKNEKVFFTQVERIKKSEQDILAEVDKKKYKTPSEEERLNQKFELFIEMVNENSRQTMHLKGSDMYGITAKLVGELMNLLVQKPVDSGFYSPGFLLKGNEEKILRTLKVDYEMI